jgi:LuxR family maltose regulon positive regulatory protein
LIDQLREATSHRLTLLIAEAGYGKTTLLADFARVSGIRTMWYRLDANDTDIVEWSNYLLAAAREHDPLFGEATAALLKEIRNAGGPPKDAYISSVISELQTLDPYPTLLVFDDFHLVEGSLDAATYVQRLLKDAPPWLSLVISSRRRPEIATGRLAVAGDIYEIGTDALRFTHDEVSELFTNILDTPLDEEVFDIVDARTTGWIASLQLFHRSIQGKSRAEIRSLARALSGAESPLYDFLAEEVLGNLDGRIVDLLIRTSILELVTAVEVAALFSDLDQAPTVGEIRAQIEEAERLGLLARSTPSSDARQLQPLLRDFLLRQLQHRESPETIHEMHRRVARATVGQDPLTAAYHFIEAGAPEEAMRALGSSVWLTIGSGRWGLASELVEQLTDVRPDPAVAAIRARQYVEAGDLAGADKLLSGADVSKSPPEVRAIFRQTELTLAWRTGNAARMLEVLADIQGDPKMPQVLQDIAAVFVDASPMAKQPGPLPDIGKRFRKMAASMIRQGLTYYSAVALHDGAVAFLNAGAYGDALDCGAQAIERFAKLPYFAPEQLSTHTVMAICEAELGNRDSSEAHVVAALAHGTEFADVPAELALLSALIGESDRASALTTRARLQQHRNRTDAVGNSLLECAAAALELRTNLASATKRLESTVFDSPLELGYNLEHKALLAQAQLLGGDELLASTTASVAVNEARVRNAQRAEARLSIILALANRDKSSLEVALLEAERSGSLALLEVVDVLLAQASLLVPAPSAIDRSIRAYPRRWLPAIRRQLEAGNTPNARAAAALLDDYGTIDDVGLLRAYAKTYAKRGPGRNLGASLARRTSPALNVHDLGRVTLTIASRHVQATAMRRKAAAVLMFLITRPGLVANREQLIDELWPEADPSNGTNNLNQSLYYLRRDIDPWYEDDFSLDYVRFQGDLVWLERDLVSADSIDFLRRAREATDDIDRATPVLASYGGQFAPEFEYDEWAIMWRSQVHSTYLQLANGTIDRLVQGHDFSGAARVASKALQIDPEATDIERRLIWLYGRLGLESAAKTQHAHLERLDIANGDEPTSIEVLLNGSLPDIE